MANKTNYNSNWSQSLSARHIANDHYRDNEAARTGFFTLVVNDLDNIYKSTFKYNTAAAPEPTNENSWMNASNNLDLHVTKFFEPDFDINVLNYTRGNEQVKFAGRPEWQSGDLQVDDVVGLNTFEILQSWQYAAYNPFTQKGGRMTNYKKTATLIHYTQDYEVIRTWTLYGCWISKLSVDDFDKENDGKRKISATLQYDWALPEKPEENKQ